MGKNILKNIGSWKAKKSGYTVIEVMAYIFISTIIIGVMIQVSIGLFKTTRKLVIDHKNMTRVESAFVNIKNILNNKENRKISVGDSTVEIYKCKITNGITTNEQLKEVKVENNQLLVVNYNKIGGRWDRFNYNLILDNVEGLEVFESENLIYVMIKREGETYYKCI